MPVFVQNSVAHSTGNLYDPFFWEDDSYARLTYLLLQFTDPRKWFINIFNEVAVWVFLEMRLMILGTLDYLDAADAACRKCFGENVDKDAIEGVFRRMATVMHGQPGKPSWLNDEERLFLDQWQQQKYYMPATNLFAGRMMQAFQPYVLLGTDFLKYPRVAAYENNMITLGPTFYCSLLRDSISDVPIIPNRTTLADFRHLRTSVLVHELAHIPYVQAAEDQRYGVEECLELARSRPDLAIMNADNYSMYATIRRLMDAYPEYDFSGPVVTRRPQLLHHCSAFDPHRHLSAGSIRDLPGYDRNGDIWDKLYPDYQAEDISDMWRKLKSVMPGDRPRYGKVFGLKQRKARV